MSISTSPLFAYLRFKILLIQFLKTEIKSFQYLNYEFKTLMQFWIGLEFLTIHPGFLIPALFAFKINSIIPSLSSPPFLSVCLFFSWIIQHRFQFSSLLFHTRSFLLIYCCVRLFGQVYFFYSPVLYI